MIQDGQISLEQKAFLRGRQKLELQTAGELEITVKRFSTLRQFKIPLWQIIPNPERIKARANGSIIGMIIFGLIELFFLIGICCIKDVGAAGALAVPMALFGIIFVACLWNFFSKQINAVIFRLRQGGQIHVWYENPDAASFKAFCETLTRRAEQAWLNRPIDSPNSLAGEIAALKRLVDSGILGEPEFQRAKSKLLEATDRKIGFN